MKTFKTLAKALMAVLMIACISSCNKDNNEDGSIFNEKKLTKISFPNGQYISFFYDQKGRLIEAEERYSDNYFKETIIWGDDAVKINTKSLYDGQESTNSYTIPLTNGMIQSYNFNSSQYTASYNQSNRLIEWGKERNKTCLIWDGDKLVSVTKDNYGHIYDNTLTYEKSCEKGYFPLLSYLIEVGHSFYLFLAHPELLGLRTNQLPARITRVYEGNDPIEVSYSYEFNNEGYISKIASTYEDEGTCTLTWN